MIWSVLLIVVGVGFLGYRRRVISRARQAYRAGDQDGVRKLTSRFAWLTGAWLGTWFLVVVVIVVVIATQR